MPPPIFGTSRCATTAPRTAASWTRICSCRKAGNTSMMRSIGLGGIVGVQGRENQVAGLGQGQRELNGLEVAHLTDQQDVGVFAQGGAQRPLEGGTVEADLALVDRREPVVVHVLDGILDGEDVERARRVDAGDDGGERGRLSRPGRAGDEDQAAGQPGHPFGDRWKAQLIEARNVRWDHPEGQRQLALLVEGAATEASPVVPGKREVDVLMFLQEWPPASDSACGDDLFDARRR